MTSLNSKLQLALLNRKKGRNLIEKGFTLVELMIVIVIVGILSSIALPQFLNQRFKAIATEATTQVGGISSAAHAESLETPLVSATGVLDDSATSCEIIQGNVNTSRFNYTCNMTTTGLTVTGTGICAQDSEKIQVVQTTPTASAGVLSNQRGDFVRNLSYVQTPPCR